MNKINPVLLTAIFITALLLIAQLLGSSKADAADVMLVRMLPNIVLNHYDYYSLGTEYCWS